MRKYLTLILIFCFSISYAQDYEFGEVSDEEVLATSYDQDPDADAVILHRGRESYFIHEHPQGWLLVTEIHERIKILSKEGQEYGTQKVRIYNQGSNKERVSKIRGYTYNSEASKVKSEKMKSSAIYDTEINDNWDEYSFTLPNVKVGSVIEFRYKVISPYFKIEDLEVQKRVPTAHYFASVRTPGYFNYKRLVKGNFEARPKDYVRKRNMSMSYEQDVNNSLTNPTKTANVQIEETVHEYEYRNIPALKEEPFVDNINNYRYLVTYELNFIKYPDGKIKKYATDWNEVAKSIFKSDNFGRQLDRNKFIREDAVRIAQENKGQLDQMKAGFDFIKSRMTWNGNETIYSYDGLSKAYKNKSGSVADINLMLVALFREMNMSANPVLVSTRDHGIPVFPTREGFNYVLACIEINGEFHLMDATEKMSVPNVLPLRVLNWEGTLIKSGGTTKKINLYPEKASQRNIMLNAEVHDDGSIDGSHKANYTLTEALQYRNENDNVSSQNITENLIDKYGFSNIEEFEIQKIKETDKPVSCSFSFEMDEGAEIIGNDIYINPLLYLTVDENPFTQEERDYPVDFGFPFSHRYIINIKVPEGYNISSLPEAISVSLPDNMGSFVFKIREMQGNISIQSSYKINNSVIPAFKYPLLKEFFNQVVSKENEKIVLSKA